MLKHSSLRPQRGFTLIELMITVVIAGVLAALSIPAFLDALDRNRLKGVAETLRSDLELMKLESIKRSASVFLSIRNDNPAAGTWCYGLSQGTNCDCTASSSCTLDTVPRIVRYDDWKGVIITAPATASPTPFSFTIEQIRGQVTLSTTLTNNRIRLTSARGKELDIEVSTLGRFVICSPSGSTNVTGYPICT
jgi:prepilin-type N-terminal cleavage/methylation domain-containing protein